MDKSAFIETSSETVTTISADIMQVTSICVSKSPSGKIIYLDSKGHTVGIWGLTDTQLKELRDAISEVID